MQMNLLRVTFLKTSALLYAFTEFCNKGIYRIGIDLFSDLVPITIDKCKRKKGGALQNNYNHED